MNPKAACLKRREEEKGEDMPGRIPGDDITQQAALAGKVRYLFASSPLLGMWVSDMELGKWVYTYFLLKSLLNIVCFGLVPLLAFVLVLIIILTIIIIINLYYGIKF